MEERKCDKINKIKKRKQTFEASRDRGAVAAKGENTKNKTRGQPKPTKGRKGVHIRLKTSVPMPGACNSSRDKDSSSQSHCQLKPKIKTTFQGAHQELDGLAFVGHAQELLALKS